MSRIQYIEAHEILDSHGNPTVEVQIRLSSGVIGRAAVPSGASVAAYEAVELRDNDNKRYLGKGVLQAVRAVNTEIARALNGQDINDQETIDRILIELDGTINKERLGSNAILGASLASAYAAANESKQPLYSYIGNENSRVMPVPMMNIISGGAHANNNIDIQEFMIMPVGARSCAEAIRMGAEIFHTLKKNLNTAGHNPHLHSADASDQSGFSPNLKNAREALDFIMEAIDIAGYKAGQDIFLALDCAASEYYTKGKYHLKGEGKTLDSFQMVDYLEDLCNNYPIFSIEDGLNEDDWKGWRMLTSRLGNRIQLVGDDLFVTNTQRLKSGIEKGVANSILIKVSQIGTLTESLAAIDMARAANYNSVLSHRSGETEDTTIADLAVATNCGQIKMGALSHSGRIAKYNQLMRIEQHLGDKAIYAGAMH